MSATLAPMSGPAPATQSHRRPALAPLKILRADPAIVGGLDARRRAAVDYMGDVAAEMEMAAMWIAMTSDTPSEN